VGIAVTLALLATLAACAVLASSLAGLDRRSPQKRPSQSAPMEAALAKERKREEPIESGHWICDDVLATINGKVSQL